MEKRHALAPEIAEDGHYEEASTVSLIRGDEDDDEKER